jgi:hypothetical protein
VSVDSYYLPDVMSEYETEDTVSINPYCYKCDYQEEPKDVLASGNWYRWTAFWDCPKCNYTHTHTGEWGE